MSLTLVQQQIDDLTRISCLSKDNPDPGGALG